MLKAMLFPQLSMAVRSTAVPCLPKLINGDKLQVPLPYASYGRLLF